MKNKEKSANHQRNNTDNKTHFSYENYRKKIKKNFYKDIIVFISVLIIGVLIFLGFAKILSPNVDVEIADNNEYTDYEDDTFQGTVDERLKKLQADDETNADNETPFTPELDEAVVLPKDIHKTVVEMEKEMQNDISSTQKIEEPKQTTTPKQEVKEDKNTAQVKNKETHTTVAPTPAQTNYRVVVGSYASEKQAEVAKSIMQDSGLGVNPIVKNIGGTYTLQVGVFSSKEKAQNSVNTLLKNNFPARIVE